MVTAPEPRHRPNAVTEQAFPLVEPEYFAGFQSANLVAPLDFRFSGLSPGLNPPQFDTPNIPSGFDNGGTVTPRLSIGSNEQDCISSTVQGQQAFGLTAGFSDGRRRSFTHPTRLDSSH